MFIKLIYFIHKIHAKSWIMDELYLSFFWRIIPPAWVFQGLGWMTFSSWIPFWNHIKLLVRSLALSSLFLTTEKREVSSANNLTLDFNPSGKSLIYIRKSKGPKMDLWGTCASIGCQFEHWPFRRTLWELSVR